jgi:indole-3-acetate monooxygenase
MIDLLDRMLRDIREMAPEIVSRAAEIEAARRLPFDVIVKLKSIGVFRMFAPRRYGGLEMDYPAGMQVISELSKIDGAIGWTVMIAAGLTMFASLVQKETLDVIYDAGPDVVFAGSGAPMGTAEATTDGFHVTGRWPFASGCLHADWMLAFCVITKNGTPLPGYAGAGDNAPLLTRGLPLVRGFILRANEWEVEDTWYAAGLKATGSNHIRVSNKFVPGANFFDVDTHAPTSNAPLYGALIELGLLGMSSFFLGTAEGALEDLVALANTGRRQQRAHTAMRESEMFQGELGRIEADLRAARAFQQVQVDHHWRHALAGTLRNEKLEMQSRQQVVWMASACGRIVDACFALAGGVAVYEDSPLQRRLRDLHTGAQHFAVQRRHYAEAGKFLLDVSKKQADGS